VSGDADEGVLVTEPHFSLRKRNGREVFGSAMYDFANSAFATTILAVIFNQYFVRVVAGGEDGVHIALLGMNWNIPGASFFNFMVATAMVVVALSTPVLGAIADISGAKKKFLAGYCLGGIVFTVLLGTVGPGDYWRGAFLFILADIGFAGSIVFYNAFLPDIAETDELGKVSGWGWAAGYVGGGLLLLVNLVMLNSPGVIGFPEGAFTVQDCFVSVALWWAVFSLPTFLWVRERPRPNSTVRRGSYVAQGFRRLGRTFRRIRRYRELIKFLFAYLIYNDGIETMIIMASVFGAQVIGMKESELIVFFLFIQAMAFLGSVFFGWLTTLIGNRRTILVTITVWIGVSVWSAFLGVFFSPRTEYWIIGFFAGAVLGGSQSASRALQGVFTPERHNAEFFSFFAISGRFSAFLGPLVYGMVVVWTRDLQKGILALCLVFVAGLILLAKGEEEKGRLEAVE
jgi:UMF1 family MFS transporter